MSVNYDDMSTETGELGHMYVKIISGIAISGQGSSEHDGRIVWFRIFHLGI